MMLSVILLSILMILLTTLSVIRRLNCGSNYWIGFWTWIWSMRHCGLGQEVACWYQCWKTLLVSFNWCNNTGAIDVKMDGPALDKKSSFKMLWLTFSSKLDWGSYIISIAKTASKKIGALIHSMKFLSSDIALYLYKSTTWPCMEYCCHVWAGAPSCYMELSNKLQDCYAGLLVLHLLPLLKPWVIVEM